MPLTITGHGGGCCGIRHMFTFNTYNPLQDGSKEDFILKALDGVVKAKLPDRTVSRPTYVSNCNCQDCIQAREEEANPEKYVKRQKEWITAVECVLAGTQYKTWKEPLEKCGFKEVFSFKNSNSSNMCHVFYGTTNPKGIESVESAPKDTEIAV